MRLRSWRGTTAVTLSPKRGFPWARTLLIALVLAIAAYLFVPNYLYVNADAIVQGNLVPIASIYRSRIDRLFVDCDDRVRAGERLAVVSNFLVQAEYERQYEQSTAQLNLSEIGLDDAVAAARTEELVAQERYAAARVEAAQLGATFRGYDVAYRSGAIGRVEWQTKRSEWQAALDAAEAARQEWAHASGRVQRVDAEERTRVASSQGAADRVRVLANRSAQEPLVAPVSGYIVDCKARPQNVVDPGAPVFDIFDPGRAYVLAFFDPRAIGTIRVGQPVDVSVAGLSGTLRGRVVAFDPQLSKLPEELTRYFWQHVQWAEYRPVRIALSGVPAPVRDQLYYNAQARVRVPTHNPWSALGVLQWLRSWK